MSGYSLRLTCRILQLISAIIILAIYSIDLQHFTTTNNRAPASFAFAEVSAGLSISLCTVHFWWILRSTWWCIPEFMLAVLWAAQAGVFGMIYLSDTTTLDEEDKARLGRMKAGIAFGLISMILWLVSFVQSLVWGCQRRKTKAGIKREVSFQRALEGLKEQRMVESVESSRYEPVENDVEQERKRTGSEGGDADVQDAVQPPAYQAVVHDVLPSPERCQLEVLTKWQGRGGA